MNKHILVAAIALIAAAVIFNCNPSSSASFTQFEDFQIEFDRSYSEHEKIYRFHIFAKNLQIIEEHNADKTQTYTLGVTQFADMTPEEFSQKFLMKDLAEHLPKDIDRHPIVGARFPDSVDWRSKGVVSAIKNQGACGSCWAFSTTGVLESAVAISTAKLNNFAQQQLVDCCGEKGFKCQGCNGAWPEWALNYISSAGIVLQNEYPYTAKVGQCKQTPTAKNYLNSARPSKMLNQGDTQALKAALAASGPISICVDASKWSLYRSGVFNHCSTSPLDHAVLAVGYQTDGTWIIKNSWGTSWGEKGFIRLASGNTCGVAEHAVIPNLA